MSEDPITDPEEIAAYVATARELYLLFKADLPIELADPPIVVKTATGARVMAWLPVEDRDRMQ